MFKVFNAGPDSVRPLIEYFMKTFFKGETMIYEVYGVFSKSGHNTIIASFRSRKNAFYCVKKDLNAALYPAFVILEKVRANTSPISLIAGRSIDGVPLFEKSFITGENPIKNPDEGKLFWSDHNRWEKITKQ